MCIHGVFKKSKMEAIIPPKRLTLHVVTPQMYKAKED